MPQIVIVDFSITVMYITYIGFLFFLSSQKAHSQTAELLSSLSEPFEEEEDEFSSAKRTTKLKYGHLEHTHLDDDYVKGSIWPKPQHETKEDVIYCVNAQEFQFILSDQLKESVILQQATKRYKKLVFPKSGVEQSQDNGVESLEIKVKNDNAVLNFDMDEYCK